MVVRLHGRQDNHLVQSVLRWPDVTGGLRLEGGSFYGWKLQGQILFVPHEASRRESTDSALGQNLLSVCTGKGCFRIGRIIQELRLVSSHGGVRKFLHYYCKFTVSSPSPPSKLPFSLSFSKQARLCGLGWPVTI